MKNIILKFKKTIKLFLLIFFREIHISNALTSIKHIIHFSRRINPFISKKYIHTGKSIFFSIKKLKPQKIQINLIVLGAQRCATTSFHNYLNSHPQIFMSKPVKEPCYYLPIDFIKKRRQSQGFYYQNHNDLLKNCMLQGFNDQEIIGESSTFYTMGDISRKYNVPEKIKEQNPNTKFIYIVRNPFSRIISHFMQNKKFTPENDINSFLSSDYYAFSNTRYYYQIEEYLKHFPIDQFKIIVFEDLIKKPNSVLNESFEYLNRSPITHFKEFKIYNNSNNQIRIDSNELIFSKDNYKKLISHLQPEFEKLEKLFNIDLKQWDLSSNTWCG